MSPVTDFRRKASMPSHSTQLLDGWHPHEEEGDTETHYVKGIDYRKLLVLATIVFLIMGSASFVVLSSRQRMALSVPDMAASLAVGVLLLACWMIVSHLTNGRRKRTTFHGSAQQLVQGARRERGAEVGNVKRIQGSEAQAPTAS